MKDITLVSHLKSLAPSQAAARPAAGGTGFAEALKSAVSEVNRSQVEADGAVQSLHTGDGQNMHDAMISLEKADISLRMMVQMRNKVLEAYQEVMRMQV
ncbi:MAG: flagellar hook-basal body complex protein FliE [Desulfuromonas sp.]|uniref:flagellar hook-basal body complex protein FliE n=1 Tax=Desulfuromonas sp. TaxID=892 RepID=UPI000CBCC65F|nr:flagellar hook-basal body complex protein FliE [Desulfuromonas sp.]PLX84501.1 MAG: flagellar hook-basal body complex protein FliE [Desulfuromonas sp.]